MQMIQAITEAHNQEVLILMILNIYWRLGQVFKFCRRCRKFGGRNFTKYACFALETNCVVEDGAQSPANYVSFSCGNAVENGKNSNQNILQLRFRFLKWKEQMRMKISEQILDKVEDLRKL